MNGDKYAGVSLQTLDEKAFDHGAVLAQTPRDSVPIPEDISLPDLTTKLASLGAELLVQGLRDGLYIPPLQDVSAPVKDTQELRHAPKLAKTEARIDWDAGRSMPSEALERRLKGALQVFGSVWTEAVENSSRKRRVIFKDVGTVRRSNEEEGKRMTMRFVGGEERDVLVNDETKRCLIQWDGDVWIDIGKATVQGSAEKEAAVALKAFMKEKKSV